MNRKLVTLTLLLGILLSLPGSALGISVSGPKNRVWEIFPDPDTSTREIGSQLVEPHWVETGHGRETASDVYIGPNVYT